MNPLVAYEKGLTTWAKWVDLNLDPREIWVFFRSMSPRHNGYIIILFTIFYIQHYRFFVYTHTHIALSEMKISNCMEKKKKLSNSIEL